MFSKLRFLLLLVLGGILQFTANAQSDYLILDVQANDIQSTDLIVVQSTDLIVDSDLIVDFQANDIQSTYVVVSDTNNFEGGYTNVQLALRAGGSYGVRSPGSLSGHQRTSTSHRRQKLSDTPSRKSDYSETNSVQLARWVRPGGGGYGVQSPGRFRGGSTSGYRTGTSPSKRPKLSFRDSPVEQTIDQSIHELLGVEYKPPQYPQFPTIQPSCPTTQPPRKPVVCKTDTNRRPSRPSTHNQSGSINKRKTPNKNDSINKPETERVGHRVDRRPGGYIPEW